MHSSATTVHHLQNGYQLVQKSNESAHGINYNDYNHNG